MIAIITDADGHWPLLIRHCQYWYTWPLLADAWPASCLSVIGHAIADDIFATHSHDIGQRYAFSLAITLPIVRYAGHIISIDIVIVDITIDLFSLISHMILAIDYHAINITPLLVIVFIDYWYTYWPADAIAITPLRHAMIQRQLASFSRCHWYWFSYYDISFQLMSHCHWLSLRLLILSSLLPHYWPGCHYFCWPADADVFTATQHYLPLSATLLGWYIADTAITWYAFGTVIIDTANISLRHAVPMITPLRLSLSHCWPLIDYRYIATLVFISPRHYAIIDYWYFSTTCHYADTPYTWYAFRCHWYWCWLLDIAAT